MAEPEDEPKRISPWEDSALGYPASIRPFPAQPTDWSAERRDTTLHELFVATVRATQGRIDWYDDKARRMGLWARGIRTMAIVLAGMAALAPLVGPALPTAIHGVPLSVSGAQVGYIALAIAGLLVALDNFFGYSTSWMRYRVSQADLVRRLARFRYDWTGRLALLDGKGGLGPADRKALVDLQRDFVDAVEATVERETRVWADSLKVSLIAFDRQNRFGPADAQPGTLEITIADPTALDPASLELTVDGTSVPIDEKGVGTVARPPGPFAAKLKARTTGGSAVAAEAGGQVQSGQTTRLTLAPK